MIKMLRILCWVTRGRSCAGSPMTGAVLCWVSHGGCCAGLPVVDPVLGYPWWILCWVTCGGSCAGSPVAGAVLGLLALDYTSSSQGLLLT